MAGARKELEQLGYTDVASFVNSGNLIFGATGKAADLESSIRAALEDRYGFEVTTFVRTAAQVRALATEKPFGVITTGHTHFALLPLTVTIIAVLSVAVMRAGDLIGSGWAWPATAAFVALALAGRLRAAIITAVLALTFGFSWDAFTDLDHGPEWALVHVGGETLWLVAVLAALLIITGIWTKISSEEFWKFSATIGVLAFATAQACLISLARLAPRFGWARTVTLLAIFFLATQIIFVIYSEVNGEGIFKLIGTTAILVAALTIMMPIFHRLSRADVIIGEADSDPSDQHLFPTVLCPRCGMTQPNSYSQITCTSCGCRFVVTIINDPGTP